MFCGQAKGEAKWFVALIAVVKWLPLLSLGLYCFEFDQNLQSPVFLIWRTSKMVFELRGTDIETARPPIVRRHRSLAAGQCLVSHLIPAFVVDLVVLPFWHGILGIQSQGNS